MDNGEFSKMCLNRGRYTYSKRQFLGSMPFEHEIQHDYRHMFIQQKSNFPKRNWIQHNQSRGVLKKKFYHVTSFADEKKRTLQNCLIYGLSQSEAIFF